MFVVDVAHFGFVPSSMSCDNFFITSTSSEQYLPIPLDGVFFMFFYVSMFFCAITEFFWSCSPFSLLIYKCWSSCKGISLHGHWVCFNHSLFIEVNKTSFAPVCFLFAYSLDLEKNSAPSYVFLLLCDLPPLCHCQTPCPPFSLFFASVRVHGRCVVKISHNHCHHRNLFMEVNKTSKPHPPCHVVIAIAAMSLVLLFLCLYFYVGVKAPLLDLFALVFPFVQVLKLAHDTKCVKLHMTFAIALACSPYC